MSPHKIVHQHGPSHRHSPSLSLCGLLLLWAVMLMALAFILMHIHGDALREPTCEPTNMALAYPPLGGGRCAHRVLPLPAVGCVVAAHHHHHHNDSSNTTHHCEHHGRLRPLHATLLRFVVDDIVQVCDAHHNHSDTACLLRCSSQTPQIDASHLYGATPRFCPRRGTLHGHVPVRLLHTVVVDDGARRDVRIMAMHVMWLAYHNRMARALRVAHAHLSGRELFARARARVIGTLQAVVLNELLPALLGQHIADESFCHAARTLPVAYREFAVWAEHFLAGVTPERFRVKHRLLNATSFDVFDADADAAADIIDALVDARPRARRAAPWLPGVGGVAPYDDLRAALEPSRWPWMWHRNAREHCSNDGGDDDDWHKRHPTGCRARRRDGHTIDTLEREARITGTVLGPTEAHLLAKQFLDCIEGDQHFYLWNARWLHEQMLSTLQATRLAQVRATALRG